MNSLITRACVLVLALTTAGYAQAQSARFSAEEMLKIERVSDPQLSPDGRWVAYRVSIPDMAANRSRTYIYVVAASGGEPRRITDGSASVSSPRWSPDGRRLAFYTAGQIWTMKPDGSDRQQVTDLSTGSSDPIWSPDGSLIAFVSDVFPDCPDDACNKQRIQEAAKNPVKARVADRLLFRHWTAWEEGKRMHVFVVPAGGGQERDLTPGDWDAPPFSLGGPADYAFSPDSKELAFARNTDRMEATSTNSDIFVVPVAGGEPRRITADNKGGDLSPLYSPDGRYLAYRSQATPTFEADRWRLMLYDRQTRRTRELLPRLDSNVDGFVFAPDSRSVFFVSGQRGERPIFNVGLEGAAPPAKLLDGFNDDLQISEDGRFLVFTRSSAATPAEIYTARMDGVVPLGRAGNQAAALTHHGDAQMARYGLRPAEEVTWTGAAGAKVAGWLFRPPDFDASKKYPLIVLIHGGPQSVWNNNWGYRWNAQVFAARGYVVFTPNPRGSISFGQQFTNEISGDWAGKAYTDIMNGVVKVAAMPFVDRSNIGAAGASYGGYMVNWMLGHNDHPRIRFKTFVSHAGIFNLTSMYGATEELWFVEWEFKGAPWNNPLQYERWSPHRFGERFKTPTLVTHGEMDFRVPVDQGLQLFTYLQRQGVESKLVVFPDEGHWIQKPGNSLFWHANVLDWLDAYLKRTT